eukprot:CAMPEP_0172162924 /NCGR_PEP_ID=MMETSP1050-20130122/6974_1 /TAXON_ID=233186 /ORGANISM="Cryptomonas curvata, Strain CCAP979/52" /LENGTH=169 /DNA_ID=CAMNT_0012833033 /DNA_START=46 /DNA_END=555 /DNA_ORIENTATION=-
MRTAILALSFAHSLGFGHVRVPCRIGGSATTCLRKSIGGAKFAAIPIRQSSTACAALKISTPLVRAEGYEAIRDILGGLPITGGYSSISDLFNKFDKNLSGKIDPVELQQTLREMGVALTDHQTFEFMRVLNSDGGDVCWSDFQGVIEQIEFDLYNSIETNDVMLDDTY